MWGQGASSASEGPVCSEGAEGRGRKGVVSRAPAVTWLRLRVTNT